MRRDEAQELKVFQEDLEMKEGESFHLRFGPLDLYIEKSVREIRVQWMTSNDSLDSSFHYQFPFQGMHPANLLKAKRFAYSGHSPVLKVLPCLGEIPFVIKPNTTLMILPGESAKIYLSTPMNIRLINGDTHQVIDEIPVLHRVKTWFGEGTTKGKVCYFTRTHGALIEENLPFRPHRALTHLYIENLSKKPISIEKLKIPVNYLTLYQGERGFFISSSLSVGIGPKQSLKGLKVFPPEENGDLTVIQPPRETIPKGVFKSITDIMR